MEALIEEQVAKEVTSANEDCVKLKAVALAYAAAAAEAATAAKMRLRAPAKAGQFCDTRASRTLLTQASSRGRSSRAAALR